MHSRWSRPLVSLGVLWSTACHPTEEGADGGAKPDASVPGTIDASIDGPIVRVLSPRASVSPDDAVLRAGDVDVECEVKPRSADQRVSPTSVQVRVYSGDGATPSAMAMTRFAADDVYAGTISTRDLPEGELRFVCSASDTRYPAGTGTDEVGTYLDLGPEVSFETPADGSAVARGDSVLIRYRVSPAPLTVGDRGADVRESVLRVNGVARDVEDEGEGVYSLSIALDEAEFPRSESTLGIEVEATNTRSATRSVQRMLVIDGEGPDIDVVSPAQESFVGQRAEISVRITDSGSGVRAGTPFVTITVEGETEMLALRPAADPKEKDLYRATLEVGKYRERAQLTLNVIAEDQAGNESRSARVVYIDTVPPWVSLDPPPVRGYMVNAQATVECSAPFDVLGGALNDRTTQDNRFSLVRAAVWERGIDLYGQRFENVSRVEPESVAFFAQSRRDVPLIVDRDGDGVCDGVDEKPDPDRPELDPTRVRLGQVRTLGYMMSGGDTADFDPPIAGVCALSGPRSAPLLCGGTELPFVAHHEVRSLGSIVYGLDPKEPPSHGCTGIDWQTTTGAGWACLVGVASDTLGNVGFSRPLRVCYDLSGSDCNTPEPSCTDGCTLPDYVMVQGMPRYVPAAP